MYRPRHPEKTTLYQIVSRFWPRLRAVWEELFEDRFGPLRRVVVKTFAGFLDCGRLDRGFARLRCRVCGEERLLAFSCKIRGVCVSCAKKRQLLFAEFVAREVIRPVPHRQVVLTIPRRLRPFFATRRRRLALLARAGYLTVRHALREASSCPRGQPGAITVIQTFGSLGDWHPHLHILCTWGMFDQAGSFHEATTCPRPEDLQEAFRERVFRFLLREGAIDLETVDSMKAWPRSGFGAHIGASIEVTSRSDGSCRAPTNLLEYFVRPTVSLRKLELTDEGQVILRSDKIHPRYQASFRVFDPLDFLALLSVHIPDSNSRSVVYAGVYSNRSRGLAKQKARSDPGTSLPPPLGPAPRDCPRDQQRRSTWARLISFVWEVDPFLCPVPGCRGEMRIIAVITQPRVVAKILHHVRGHKSSGPDPPPSEPTSPTRGQDLQRELFLDDLPWGEQPD